MVYYRCYKADSLLKMLGDSFHIVNKNVQHKLLDWVNRDVNVVDNANFYITNMDNIKEIVEYNGLWNEKLIKLTDGTELKLHSSNINSNDSEMLRIVNNTFFSPSFKRQENYILANKDLDSWLLFNGITEKQLEDASETFSLSPTFVYKDVYEPVIKNGQVCGSYHHYLRLTEDEIDKALADIIDVEMRVKICMILKSFEKTYRRA
ncbi:MAG: hypothetical protein IKV59_02940 [Lachnospiraceae bacterium]|nr:hypothetical protein [Lachnospiraceae bacterium]